MAKDKEVLAAIIKSEPGVAPARPTEKHTREAAIPPKPPSLQ